MAAVKMICRVCGKEYSACRNVKKVPGVFRWQEVACSPECGDAYLAAVMAARNPAPAKSTKRAKKSEPVAIQDESPVETDTDSTVDPVVSE